MLGGKIDAVTETAQQLIDNQHYAAGDIQNSVEELKNKWVLLCSTELNRVSVNWRIYICFLYNLQEM